MAVEQQWLQWNPLGQLWRPLTVSLQIKIITGIHASVVGPRDFVKKVSDHLSKLQNLLSTSSLRQIPQSQKVQLKQDKKKKSCNE